MSCLSFRGREEIKVLYTHFKALQDSLKTLILMQPRCTHRTSTDHTIIRVTFFGGEQTQSYILAQVISQHNHRVEPKTN